MAEPSARKWSVPSFFVHAASDAPIPAAAKYARFPDSIPDAIITQAASRNAPTGTSACWLAANPTKQGVASSVNALSDGHGAPRSSAVARTATASPASRYEAPAGTQTGCARTSWNPCATIPGTSSG